MRAAPQTIAPLMVLHPNPPPTWEEGIQALEEEIPESGRDLRDGRWLPCWVWLVRERQLVAIEVCCCFAAFCQLAE
jgi:hypothetical protein